MHLSNLQFVTYMYKWTTLANYSFRPDIGQIHIRAACPSSEVVQYLAIDVSVPVQCPLFFIHEYDDLLSCFSQN